MTNTPAAAALVALRRLVPAVRAEQAVRGLSQRAAAQQIGVPKTVLQELLAGFDAKLSTVLRCLEWLDTSRPVPPPDTLTGAARATLSALLAARGVGQAWLRVEPRSFGLLVPDPAGTLNELARVRGIAWSTWGELEAAGLVTRGQPSIAPPA